MPKFSYVIFVTIVVTMSVAVMVLDELAEDRIGICGASSTLDPESSIIASRD